MNEIRDILVGIDFGKEQSQISYYDRKAQEALSVPMKVGTSQYEFPTCICRRPGKGDWCFGREAEYFAKEHEGFLVENLYELCQQEGSVRVTEEEMQPWELLAVFLEKALRTLGSSQPVSHIKCLVITVEQLSSVMVGNLRKACEKLGFTKGKYMFQDYSESFYFYTLSQRQEYWSRNVAWFAFTPESVTYRALQVMRGSRPVLVSISRSVDKELPADANLRDLEFYQFVSNMMGTEIFSSIFITGQGFHQEWAVKSIPLLCRQKRKVFFGTNLFAKGACYTAKEKLENHFLKEYLYAGDALVRTNIGMEMQVMGSPALYPLISAGVNWYEASSSVELILDDRQELIFTLSSMETGEKRRVSMALPGLPVRPNRTTRLLVELDCQSPDSCKVTVQDLGFGDMYPSSGRVWAEQMKW